MQTMLDERLTAGLNPAQREAVLHVNGPLGPDDGLQRGPSVQESVAVPCAVVGESNVPENSPLPMPDHTWSPLGHGNDDDVKLPPVIGAGEVSGWLVSEPEHVPPTGDVGTDQE